MSFDGQPAQYQPGDVVNGHVLTADGAWVPLGAQPQQQPGAQIVTTSGQPVVIVQADNSNNTSLAPVTALVSGLIGLFLSWIPILGIVGWVLGPLALVFGILGLKRGKAEHKIMSWIGIVSGGITLLVCFLYVLMFVSAFSA